MRANLLQHGGQNFLLCSTSLELCIKLYSKTKKCAGGKVNVFDSIYTFSLEASLGNTGCTLMLSRSKLYS